MGLFNFSSFRLPFVPSLAVVAGSLLGLSASPVQAQQAGGFALEIPDINNYVAVAAGVIPDYMGSDDYTFGAAPNAFIKFGDSERYVRLLITQLSVNVLDNESWSLGPTVNYRFGRSDSVEDNVVGRMKDVDGTVEAGAFVGWKWVGEPDPRQRISISAEFLHDVTGEHDGYSANANIKAFQPVSRAITLGAGVGTTYGSSNFMSTYFGVDGVDAARSGLPFYDADPGFRDVRLQLGAIVSFSPNWHLGTGVVYQRLLGEAADSPIVDNRGSKDQFYAGAGLAYAW